MEPKDRIIVALDVDNLDKMKRLVEQLWDQIGCFKVGLELIHAVGTPWIIQWFGENDFGGGKKVFLDAKLKDIPNTMKGAAKAITVCNVKMFNVHATAGIEGMMATKEGVEEIVKKMSGEVTVTGGDLPNPLILAVTVLTSFEENNVHLIYGAPSKAKVIQLARDALLAGMDGIVCSPQELEILGKQKELSKLLRVTPGIRPEWAVVGDQKRIGTPAGAISAGADYLVIGRPITNPPAEIGSPLEAVKRIQEEIASVEDKEK
ncbi:MAG: orotidine-5'-phosphate decarboxylase [Candidatus Curtissbacteria bacterium]|nr:orotidine-5'-phosphate decarboxylase [Candidatus Curtissbacteria bacterium]MDZ4209655.1 orotidine-5'-phosphate decarboxylase [Candidatus Curtissbacteria bacterium]